MRLSKFVALVLVFSVAAVLIAPVVNLEPTALRSIRTVLAVFAALCSLLLLGFGDFRHLLAELCLQFEEVLPPFESVLDLTCTRLC
jgi:hypothetical protein